MPEMAYKRKTTAKMATSYSIPTRELPIVALEVNPSTLRSGNAILQTAKFFFLVPAGAGQFFLFCKGEDRGNVEQTPNDVLVDVVRLDEAAGAFSNPVYEGPTVNETLRTQREGLYVQIATALFAAGYADGTAVQITFA